MELLEINHENIGKKVFDFLNDNRNTLLPVDIHLYSVRDYDYLRELVDHRSAVLCSVESTVLLSSPRFHELFGKDVQVWISRTMLVDVALQHDSSLEQLLESEEDSTSDGNSHMLYVEYGTQRIMFDLREVDRDEVNAEHIFSYFDQTTMLNKIKDIYGHFGNSGQKHLTETLIKS